GGPRIALIHATRGRPQQAAMARKIWLDLAENPPAVEHIFMIDEDDADSVALKRMHHRMVPPGGGCVAAWNMGVFSVSAPVLVQMSDDWIPMPQWDRLILERIGDVTKPKVLAISDGVRADRLLCMAICTRAYVAEDCFLFHPAFMGVYSDNWFTDEAYRRGAVIEARDIRFVHEHPIKTGKPMDKTYAEQNSQARYAEGLEIYLRLQSGRDWSSIPGWFDYWWVYDQIAEQLRDGDTAVEVGVWLGRSITYLAQRLKAQGKRVKLIAVDTFKGEANQPAHTATIAAHGGSIRAAFEANIARCEVADMIEIIVGDSAASAFKVANGSVAFCFIDAAHDYDSVKADILAWEPKIKPEGTLAGHDALQPAVYNAVTLRHPKAKFIGPCWIVRRDVTKGTDATVNDLVQPAVVS
ncbi:MAG: class I SAM-dependent methyltransferase, partial [Verrucomicrobia bacterium]|nr:class I SAM-dependent methyltransferase [Verrucomicrobiota bacterium]